jgi:hypothetical protein
MTVKRIPPSAISQLMIRDYKELVIVKPLKYTLKKIIRIFLWRFIMKIASLWFFFLAQNFDFIFFWRKCIWMWLLRSEKQRSHLFFEFNVLRSYCCCGFIFIKKKICCCYVKVSMVCDELMVKFWGLLLIY